MRPAALVGCAFALALALNGSGCRSPYYADRGAALGGVAGALTGAAIGNQSGKLGTGALVGGTVGALAGSAIGDAIDADIAHNRALVEARMGRQMSGAVTVHDVVAMSHAGLSDNVIVTHVRANGVAQPLEVPDLILLRDNGVSDAVVQAMQQPPVEPVAVARQPASRPVVVEHHYGPYWYPPPHYYRAYPPRRSRSSSHIHFSFGR